MRPTCEQVTGSGSTRRRGCLKAEIALVFFAEQHAREPGGVERADRSPLPTLWQVAIGRALGGNLRLLRRHFPFETCGRKWRDRKGRAIHTQSDRPLYKWGDTLFANAVKI